MQEAPVWIAINDTRRVMLACAPHDRASLALGHLLAEGWIQVPADVLSLTLVDGPGGASGIDVTIEAGRVDAVLALRQHRLEHGCGLRHALDCDRPSTAPARDGTVSDATSLFRPLFAAADDASPEGGVHAAALSDGHELLHTAVDVARHSAVDRAIGLGIAGGARLETLGLVTTARVSGAIALKAANAGLAWIASRSIATSLAHEIATAFGVRILERAARPGSAGT